MLFAVYDIFCLLVYLIADTVYIRTGCRYHKKQWLFTRITRTLCHNVVKLTVGQRNKQPILCGGTGLYIEAVLSSCFRRQYLIKASRRQIYDPLSALHYFASSVKRRAHSHHVRRNIKDDRSLLSVCRT